MTRWFLSIPLWLTLSGLLPRAFAGNEPAPPSPPARQKLMVLLVVDQFRYDYLLKILPYVGERGFRRLLRDGCLLTNARYGYASTYTAAGHACLATGAFLDRTGIVANEFFDRSLGRSVSLVDDPGHPVLGSSGGPDSRGVSPRWLKVPTIGDALVDSTGGRSRVVAVSLKDRTAVMLAGRKGRAYWYDETSGLFTTSTYYTKKLPPWLDRFHQGSGAGRYFGKPWDLVMPRERYLLHGIDDFPYEGDIHGLGRTFPHRPGGGESRPGTVFHDQFSYTPFSNEYVLDAAVAAVDGEGLGLGGSQDFLAVSVNGTDFGGHAFGPDSWEMLDMYVRLDAQLAAFLEALDRRVGGAYSLVVTGDHGSCPLPEHRTRLGYSGGRIPTAALVGAVEKTLCAAHGQARWIQALQDPCVYLDHVLIANKGLDPALVRREAAAALAAVPGVDAAFTCDELERGAAGDERLGLFTRSFDRERSGDLLIATRPFYLWAKYADRGWGVAHGTHHDYDRHVPLFFMGCAFGRGVFADPVDTTSVAATIAAALGIVPPASCQGRPLAFVLERGRR